MLEIRRSRDRGYADRGWLRSYFSFSYADYYDPEHVDFGPLNVLNEDFVRPGAGYPGEHRRDVQVLTYLIEGELQHRDSLGNDAVLRAGGLQCVTAGTGISHTEFTRSGVLQAHLLHICINAADRSQTPGYAQTHLTRDDKRGRLRLLASPDGADGSMLLEQDVSLYGGLFDDSQAAELELRSGRCVYMHVLSGSIVMNETRLNAGDGIKVLPPNDIVLQHGRKADVLLLDLPQLSQSGSNDRPAARRTATSGT